MLRGAAMVIVGLLAVGPSRAQPVPSSPANGQGQLPIKGQDPDDAMRGQGPTGWVQAPEPRGFSAPEREAQGAGAGARARVEGGQAPTGENPYTPIPHALPNASGMAPQVPSK